MFFCISSVIGILGKKVIIMVRFNYFERAYLLVPIFCFIVSLIDIIHTCKFHPVSQRGRQKPAFKDVNLILNLIT